MAAGPAAPRAQSTHTHSMPQPRAQRRVVPKSRRAQSSHICWRRICGSPCSSVGTGSRRGRSSVFATPAHKPTSTAYSPMRGKKIAGPNTHRGLPKRLPTLFTHQKFTLCQATAYSQPNRKPRRKPGLPNHRAVSSGKRPTHTKPPQSQGWKASDISRPPSRLRRTAVRRDSPAPGIGVPSLSIAQSGLALIVQ